MQPNSSHYAICPCMHVPETIHQLRATELKKFGQLVRGRSALLRIRDWN